MCSLCSFHFAIWPSNNPYTFFNEAKDPNGEIIKTTAIFLKLFHVSTAPVSDCTAVAFTVLLAWKIKRL